MRRRFLLLSLILPSAAAGWLVTSGVAQKGNNTEVLSAHEKLSYLDPVLMDFVRPGLTVKLEEPSAGSDRRIRVKVRITDPKGLPLDRDGITTPGAVTTSFVLAYLPSSDSAYVSYATRNQTSPITRLTATQATSDSGGSYEKISDGLYAYTSGTVLPANFNAALTHTIGVYGTRDLTEFELGRQFSNDVISFVPDGSSLPAVREIAKTANCNNCHDPLSAHGGARRDVRVCVLCHTPQTTDPDTNNTVDFKVMIHKIHSGADLPSVKAGTPYRIIGFQQGVNDYSDVRFPDDVRNCDRCHDKAPQALNYLTKPSRAVCGSCHDDVDFATGKNHAENIVQTSDEQCATCHIPVGDKDFDASIKGAHTVPTKAEGLNGVNFEILGVENGTPGNRPTVRFTIRDKSGRPVMPSSMTSFSLVLAGPATDYTAYLRDDARTARVAGTENFWTFSKPIDPAFRGSMAVGIEGYRNQTFIKGDNSQLTVRDAGFNKVFYFDTQGNKAVPRRSVVKMDGCNSCHGVLAMHGGQRQNTEYCVLCHTPIESDKARRPADKAPVESVHFKTLIHRIHAGERQQRDFTIYGFGNTANNFNKVRFPGDLRNCTKCHAEGKQQLPLPDGVEASLSPRDYLNPMPPETAACLSCHTTKPVAVHAQLNSSALGEACAVCHGPRGQFSVDRVHAR